MTVPMLPLAIDKPEWLTNMAVLEALTKRYLPGDEAFESHP